MRDDRRETARAALAAWDTAVAAWHAFVVDGREGSSARESSECGIAAVEALGRSIRDEEIPAYLMSAGYKSPALVAEGN